MDGNLQAFDHIPASELYIFPGTYSFHFDKVTCALPNYMCVAQPPPENITEDEVIPNNTPYPFTFQLSKVPAVKKIGGLVKIVDTRTFTVSEKISAAEVEIEVGGMR